MSIYDEMISIWKRWRSHLCSQTLLYMFRYVIDGVTTCERYVGNMRQQLYVRSRSQMKLSTKVSNSREATLCQKRAQQISPCHPNSCHHLAMNVWQRTLIPWYNLLQETNTYTKTLCYALLCAHVASDMPACSAFAPNNITYRQCSCNTAFVTEHHTLCMFRWYIWFQ